LREGVRTSEGEPDALAFEWWRSRPSIKSRIFYVGWGIRTASTRHVASGQAEALPILVARSFLIGGIGN
jgi:hypothetical protein